MFIFLSSTVWETVKTVAIGAATATVAVHATKKAINKLEEKWCEDSDTNES